MKETESYFEIESNGRKVQVCKNRDPFWTARGIQLQVYEEDEDDDFEPSSTYINLTNEAIDELIEALKKCKNNLKS